MSSKTDGEVSPTLKVKNHIELIDFNAVTAMIAFSKIISFYQKKYIECDKIYLILGLTGLLHSLFCYKWPVDIFTILSNYLSLFNISLLRFNKMLLVCCSPILRQTTWWPNAWSMQPLKSISWTSPGFALSVRSFPCLIRDNAMLLINNQWSSL